MEGREDDEEVKDTESEISSVGEESLEDKWWNAKFDALAAELPNSVLKSMKERVLNSKIQKQKLTLNDDSPHMENFFTKEIELYNKKLNKQQQVSTKQKELDDLEAELKQQQNEYKEEITKTKQEVEALKEILRQKEELQLQLQQENQNQKNEIRIQHESGEEHGGVLSKV